MTSIFSQTFGTLLCHGRVCHTAGDELSDVRYLDVLMDSMLHIATSDHNSRFSNPSVSQYQLVSM
jgi:hypothetical protein